MKKGLKTLIGGIVIFILFAFALPVAIIAPMVNSDSEDAPFLVPGEHLVDVENEGKYYLWHEFRTIHDGKSYNRPEELPHGIEFSIKTAEGETLPFVAGGGASSSNGQSSKTSVGYVEVSRPETLTISVSGNTEPLVFSFSESIFLKMFGTIMGGILVSIIGAFSGIGVTIWGIIKMVKSPNPPALSS